MELIDKVFKTEEERNEYIEKIIIESMYYNLAIKFIEYGTYYNEQKFTIKYTYVD